MSDEHCRDCCCARSWKALGITDYTGKSIPEHIEQLRAERDEAKRLQETERQRADAYRFRLGVVSDALAEARARKHEAGCVLPWFHLGECSNVEPPTIPTQF